MSKKRFEMLCALSHDVGETNDCVVKAISLLTDTPYHDVRSLLYKKGWRKPRKGSYFQHFSQAFPLLGFELLPWENYLWQGYGKTIRTFGRNFKSKRNLLVLTHRRQHAVAVVRGEVCDWSEGRCKRIGEVYEVRRL